MQFLTLTIDPRSYAHNLGDQLPYGLTLSSVFFFLPAQLASTSLRYMRVVHVLLIVNY